jgi:CubicO group peptidase (beta-lactamase class C family)
VANTVATRFAIASGTKGLTALTVVGLIEDGHLTPATTARIKLSFPWSIHHGAPRTTGPHWLDAVSDLTSKD